MHILNGILPHEDNSTQGQQTTTSKKSRLRTGSVDLALIAMARKKLIPTGPTHLQRVVESLRATPKLTLSSLKSLKLTLAFRNDHFGARHFVKDLLPRIRYANPALDIQVQKVPKTPEERWRPEMELEFANGKHHTLNMHEKWSTTILRELMDSAGGDPWAQWKAEAKAAGIPAIPGEVENAKRVVKRPTQGPLPSLEGWKAMTPAPKEMKETKEQNVPPPSIPKVGVAASLP